jgi:anaerobic ribonucleoside-triphosphate reductase activating protein
MSEITLRLRRLCYPVTALGPGRRLVLWVTGCSLRCPGCISPELQDPTGGRVLPPSRVLARILGIGCALDGITLTGGEPFEQAHALAELLERLAPARPGWNLLVYSGFTLSHLERRGAGARRLLACSDILVAGPYLADHPPTHPLTGSGNQQVHFLSARGAGLRAHCDGLAADQANLGAGRHGRDLLIGILSPAARARLHGRFGLMNREMGHG